MHVQNLGDQLFRDSQWVGTKGQSLRLEGFAIDVTPPMSGLGLEYMCHLQDTGDTPWMAGGSFCGTRGQSRRLEGLAIRLTGPGAANYDIYYSCHLQDLGDEGPAVNGAFCGTRGQSRRLEALEVWVLPKGSPPPLFSSRTCGNNFDEYRVADLDTGRSGSGLRCVLRVGPTDVFPLPRPWLGIGDWNLAYYAHLGLFNDYIITATNRELVTGSASDFCSPEFGTVCNTFAWRSLIFSSQPPRGYNVTGAWAERWR